MTTYNSIRSISYLLYLIVFITSGCAEKTTSHAFVNEVPPAVEHAVYTKPTLTEPVFTKFIAPIIKKADPVDVITSITKEPAITTDSTDTTQYNTVWDRLLSLYALPEIKNDRIDHEVQRFLKNPKFLGEIQQRAEPYLYFILDEIEAKKIPGELALLPVIESAFKSHAISKSKAVGLWQFMPATGRYFGLKQNWWYDGRKDAYSATQAATTYLRNLATLFDDDWALALAAYNAGKGTIGKAIRRNKKKKLPTDYWSLSLYKETMDYVPRLLAIAKIFANTEKYGIPLYPIPNKPYFSVVETESQIDLNMAAKMANTPTADFLALNAGFKRSTTDPKGPYRLLIHADKANIFKNNLALTGKKDRVKTISHRIKAGENLGFLAKKYSTSIEALRQTNHLSSNNIRKGQLIHIPSSFSSDEESINKKFYTVKKGDTFWNIARQFAVQSKDIASWNNLSLNQALHPGQKLIIEES